MRNTVGGMTEIPAEQSNVSKLSVLFELGMGKENLRDLSEAGDIDISLPPEGGRAYGAHVRWLYPCVAGEEKVF